MENLIRINAEEIARIIKDCTWIQNSNESDYTKEQAKISAYNEITDLIAGGILDDGK